MKEKHENASIYGVLQEQGDLGLGFNPVTDEEKKKLKGKNNEGNNRPVH